MAGVEKTVYVLPADGALAGPFSGKPHVFDVIPVREVASKVEPLYFEVQNTVRVRIENFSFEGGRVRQEEFQDLSEVATSYNIEVHDLNLEVLVDVSPVEEGTLVAVPDLLNVVVYTVDDKDPCK